MTKSIHLVGAPVDCGGGQPGCLMGPDMLRTAGLAPTLKSLGHSVDDTGNLMVDPCSSVAHANTSIHDLGQLVAWIKVLEHTAFAAFEAGAIPVFMGGDHSLSAGTISGAARFSHGIGRQQFVLWLDAHTDFHTLESTESGNLHGTPVAYISGQPGFDGYYPKLAAPVNPQNICMLGIRSVDQPERDKLARRTINVHDMRQIDERGIAAPLGTFLETVKNAGGRLHISLDVDFLEPEIAPAVGTTVPGGATFREAHLVMEMLHDSNLVTSMDIAELNPFLDERGRTAKLLVDLVGSLFGKRVMDRPTRSF